MENVHTGEAERKNRYAGVHVSVCIFRCVFSQSSILYEPILALIFREYKRYFGRLCNFYGGFTGDIYSRFQTGRKEWSKSETDKTADGLIAVRKSVREQEHREMREFSDGYNKKISFSQKEVKSNT